MIYDTQIKALQLRAIALRSSIHNEQQYTAVELAGMVAKKTNELIDVINEICEIVKKLDTTAHELEVQYDELTEALNIVVKEV